MRRIIVSVLLIASLLSAPAETQGAEHSITLSLEISPMRTVVIALSSEPDAETVPVEFEGQETIISIETRQGISTQEIFTREAFQVFNASASKAISQADNFERVVTIY